MASAFNFQISTGIGWLPAGGAPIWPLAGGSGIWLGWKGIILLLVGIAILILHIRRMRHIRVWNLIVCLLWFSLWQVSCTHPDAVEDIAAARQGTDPRYVKPYISPTTVRVPKTPPPPTPQGLPVPAFAQQTGIVAFGTKIRLSVSTLPPGAVIEYSHNNGKTWVPGDQAPVLGTGPIMARTRINDLSSEASQAAFTPYYQRMMVIGNSIMAHPPLPAKGWFNNNGMAASSPENDFVHLLAARLAQQYPNLQVGLRLVQGVNFEQKFGQSGYSPDEFNEHLAQFKPDLIIVRLGENVDETEVLGPRNFEAHYRQLLERLATYNGQPVKIVCTTSVWKRTQTDIVIRRVAAEKSITLVDLSSMVGKDEYLSFNRFADAAVGAHPNDLAMRRIAELIWEKLP
jgi:hypothetical protein